MYFEDKKHWEQKDQRNKAYIQELENKLKMSSQRFSSTSEEVAMIVAWAVKLRKTLNDSKDMASSKQCSNLTVSTCPSMEDTYAGESIKSQASSGSMYGIHELYGTPKNAISSPPLTPSGSNLTQSLSQEYVNLSQVKEEMQKKLQSIEVKEIISDDSTDDNTEFDAWSGQPHNLATDSFLTHEEA